MEIIETVRKLNKDYSLYSPILGLVMYSGITQFKNKECIKVRYFLDTVEYTELFTSEGKFINIKDSKCLWISDKMMLFVNDNCDCYDWVILENQLT